MKTTAASQQGDEAGAAAATETLLQEGEVSVSASVALGDESRRRAGGTRRVRHRDVLGPVG